MTDSSSPHRHRSEIVADLARRLQNSTAEAFPLSGVKAGGAENTFPPSGAKAGPPAPEEPACGDDDARTFSHGDVIAFPPSVEKAGVGAEAPEPEDELSADAVAEGLKTPGTHPFPPSLDKSGTPTGE